MRLKIKATNEILRGMFLSHDQPQGAIPRIRLRIRSWLVFNTNSFVATEIMILSWEKFQVKELDHDPCSRVCPRLWRGTSEWGLITVGMSQKYISNLFQDSKIQFDFKLNLTSVISDLSKLQHLASYVSCHNAMAYDTCPHKWSYQTWKSCGKKPWYKKK